MYETLKNFPEQFAYEPVIENKEKLVHARRYIIAGMGGSHLAADLLKISHPHLTLTIHSDYGLPDFPETDLKESLFIASSYSGTTEETIDALKEAIAKGIPAGVIAVGGTIIEMAKKNSLPYIELPNTGIQPRCASGYSFRALLALLGEETALKETKELPVKLSHGMHEEAGVTLAAALQGYVPVIYSSRKNAAIAYNWKIKFNENTKIPAFYNMVPELNHNEMNGFDAAGATKGLAQRFSFVFLTDENDHPRVKRRFEILEKLYRERDLTVHPVPLEGETVFERIFSSLMKGDWTSYYAAKGYEIDPEPVPMVEQFKKLI